MMATNLCLNAEQRGEETRDPDGGEVLGGEVPVEAPELVEGEHDAQEVDQDPERVEDVVPVRALNSNTTRGRGPSRHGNEKKMYTLEIRSPTIYENKFLYSNLDLADTFRLLFQLG